MRSFLLASGGDDGPAMPKLRKEGSVGHQNYPSHPATPQSNAVPSPGAASSVHEDYGEMNSPGWPRTPASPVRKYSNVSTYVLNFIFVSFQISFFK